MGVADCLTSKITLVSARSSEGGPHDFTRRYVVRKVRCRSPLHRPSGCGCLRSGLGGSGFLFGRHRERQVSGAPREASESGSFLARFLGSYASSATVLDDRSIPLAQAQDAEMVEENTRFVQEAGANGVVLLGRNGALILSDIPTALHV